MVTNFDDLGHIVSDFVMPKRGVSKVFIHCSATSNPDVNATEVHRWHWDKGWSGIGYHFFIMTNGTVKHGRSLEKMPAAQAGHNWGSIAICLNGLKEEDFTPAQMESVRWLCGEINKAYHDIGAPVTFHGHKEVSARACPVFDYKTVLELDGFGYTELGLAPHEDQQEGALIDRVARLEALVEDMQLELEKVWGRTGEETA